MSKEEFLNELRTALMGNVSSAVINENVDYYEDYINTEVRKGRTEEEVLESLGEPRLLAKTVIDTAAVEERRGPDETDTEETAGTGSGDNDVMPWWRIVILIFVIMAAVYIVFSVLSFLAPVLVPAIIICAIIFLLKHR